MATVTTSTPGASVVIVSRAERTSSNPTTTRRDRVQPARIRPRPEHGPVVAEQQQEHRRARQQHARERLNRRRRDPERQSGSEHDRRRDEDESGEAAVEDACVAPAPMQRVLHAEHVAECVRARERDDAGAEEGGVQEHEREQRPGRAPSWCSSPVATLPASTNAPCNGVPSNAKAQVSEDRDRADDEEQRPDQRVDPLVRQASGR